MSTTMETIQLHEYEFTTLHCILVPLIDCHLLGGYKYCYGKGVQKCVLLKVVPFSEGPLSEVPL